MTMAEDKRPEANRLVELRPNALQRHTCPKYEVDVSLSMPEEYRVVTDSISDAMPNSHITVEVVNSEELLKYIAISTDKIKFVRCSIYGTKGKQDVEHEVMSCHYLHLIS
jgi:hypothetical protein